MIGHYRWSCLDQRIFAFVCARTCMHASACVRVHLRACVYVQKIKRLDASRRKRNSASIRVFLFKDFWDILYIVSALRICC